MKQIAVEVVEDSRRPEGGHAIILLRGLNVLPSPSEFKIEPVDGLANVSETSDWPLGTHKPVEARLTEQGVELVAGPDIVESPHLLPGTPVVISVPAAGVEAEVLWPNVTPLVRPERRPVIAVADMLSRAVQEHNGHARDSAIGSADGEKPALVLSSLSAKHLARDSVNGTAALSASLPSKAEPPAAQEPLKTQATMRSRATVRRLPLQRALRSEGDDGARLEHRAAGEEKYYPIQRYETPVEARPAADKTSRRLAGVAIAVAIVAALSSILGNLLRPASSPVVIPATAMGDARAGAPRSTPPQASIYEVLATPPVSPRGVNSDGVSLAQALEKADAHLHGPASGRDANEGAYWLKRAVAASLSDARTQWALTQLGSLYAEPLQGAPDYGKARLFWEIAGGLGDPVALCFLGSLSEFGIGGSVDRTAALNWYERAKRAGGCKQIDEALKRVKQ